LLPGQVNARLLAVIVTCRNFLATKRIATLFAGSVVSAKYNAESQIDDGELFLSNFSAAKVFGLLLKDFASLAIVEG